MSETVCPALLQSARTNDNGPMLKTNIGHARHEAPRLWFFA